MLLRVARVFVLSAVACLVFLVWRFNQTPFDLAMLDKLVPGMTQDQVRQQLGRPSSVFKASWAYSAFMAWPIVYIYFDDSGNYERHEYDH